jgi:carbohydrate-selective porin OprB
MVSNDTLVENLNGMSMKALGERAMLIIWEQSKREMQGEPTSAGERSLGIYRTRDPANDPLDNVAVSPVAANTAVV